MTIGKNSRNSLLFHQPGHLRRGMGQDTFSIPTDEGITLGTPDQLTLPSLTTINSALAQNTAAAYGNTLDPASTASVAGMVLNAATGTWAPATATGAAATSSLPMLILVAGGALVVLFAMK